MGKTRVTTTFDAEDKNVSKVLKDLADEIEDFAEDAQHDLDRLGDELGDLEQDGKKGSKGILFVVDAFNLLVSAAKLAKKAILDYGLGLALADEKSEAAFKTLLGGSVAAKKLNNEIKELEKGFFTLGEFQESALSLGNLGPDAIAPKLEQLSNIAAATGTELTELAEKYGRLQVQGRITSQQLRTLPIDVVKEMANNAGLTTEAFIEMGKKGGVAFGNLELAVDTLTRKHGAMASGIANQTNTLTGGWQKLRADFDTLVRNISGGLLPVMNELVKLINLWVEGWKEGTTEAERNESMMRGITILALDMLDIAAKMADIVRDVAIATGKARDMTNRALFGSPELRRAVGTDTPESRQRQALLDARQQQRQNALAAPTFQQGATELRSRVMAGLDLASQERREEAERERVRAQQQANFGMRAGGSGLFGISNRQIEDFFRQGFFNIGQAVGQVTLTQTRAAQAGGGFLGRAGVNMARRQRGEELFFKGLSGLINIFDDFEKPEEQKFAFEGLTNLRRRIQVAALQSPELKEQKKIAIATEKVAMGVGKAVAILTSGKGVKEIVDEISKIDIIPRFAP